MADREYPSYYMPLFKGSQLSFDGLTVVLWTRAHEPLGIIHNIDKSSMNWKHTLDSGNSLSFDVYKTMDGEQEELWDKIIDHKLIFVPELRDVLEITISDEDSDSTVKSVSAVSAGIAELSQTIIYNFEANTEDDIARDDYVVTKFYDAINPKGSLMNRILEKTPQYSVAYIDDSLKNLQRTISASGKDVWSVLSKDIGEAFNCLFLIDNIEKQIYAYDLEVVCNDCLHSGDSDRVDKSRFEYGSLDDIGECPTCGSDDLTYFGEDTTFYIDKENLTDGVQINVDADSIKNTMKLTAGDDLMTATVRALNPNGSDYITQFNEETLDDMPDELVDKIKEYQKLYDELQPEYQQIMKNLFNAYDWQLYYQSGMMPGAEDPDGNKHGVSPDRGAVDAGSQAKLLNVEFERSDFKGVAMPRVTIATSQATVDSTILNYARSVVKAGYVKVELDGQSTWQNLSTGGTMLTEGTGIWKGRMKLTTYASSSTKKEDLVEGIDYAYTDTFTIDVNSDYKTYLDQYLFKSITRQMNSADADEGSIYSVFTIKDNYDDKGRFVSVSDDFTLALTYYSLNRLTSFKDAYENCLAILSGEADNTNARVYKDTYTNIFNDGQDGFQVNIYNPYVERLKLIQAELDKRAATVKEWTDKIEEYTQEKNAIQKKLDFQVFLGEDLYHIYCGYRREDEYNNSNYVSEGLDNAELFKKAKQFLDAAYKELDIAATPQYQITLNMHNLLKRPEFKDIVDKFVVGNWIRVRGDNKLFRVRLTSFSMNFGDLTKLNVEFSNVTVSHTIVSDVKDILNSAKSMATTYKYNAQKASLGDDAYKTSKEFYRTGLVSAMDRIKTNTDETITWGPFGILAREYDDTTNDYKDEQLQITHNVIAFTKDGWNTASMAMGKQTYTAYDKDKFIYNDYNEDYGMNARFMQAGQVNGSQMIGGIIYSSASIEKLDDDNKPIQETIQDVNGIDHTYNQRIPITIIDLDNGSFSFGNDEKGEGKLSYSNDTNVLTVHGNIYSDSGKIAGWTIASQENGAPISGLYREGVTGSDGNTYNLYLGQAPALNSGTLDYGLHMGHLNEDNKYDADIDMYGNAVFHKLTMSKGSIVGADYNSFDGDATSSTAKRMKLDAARLEFFMGNYSQDEDGKWTGGSELGSIQGITNGNNGVKLIAGDANNSATWNTMRSALSSYNSKGVLNDSFYTLNGIGYFGSEIKGNGNNLSGLSTVTANTFSGNLSGTAAYLNWSNTDSSDYFYGTAASAGNADTLDGYHATHFVSKNSSASSGSFEGNIVAGSAAGKGELMYFRITWDSDGLVTGLTTRETGTYVQFVTGS